MLRNSVAATALVVVVLLGGCTLLSHEAPPEDIDKAAALFFQRLEKQEYDVIYNDAAKDFKQKKTREIVADSLKQLTAYGKVLDYRRIRLPFEGEGKERMASPVFGTSFEQMNGELTLNFRDEGGEWKLLGFAFKPRTIKTG